MHVELNPRTLRARRGTGCASGPGADLVRVQRGLVCWILPGPGVIMTGHGGKVVELDGVVRGNKRSKKRDT